MRDDVRYWMKNHTESTGTASLTRLFDLRLPRLGGGDQPGRGLRDAPGRLLQPVQVPAVLVRFDLTAADFTSSILGLAARLEDRSTRPPPLFRVRRVRLD